MSVGTGLEDCAVESHSESGRLRPFQLLSAQWAIAKHFWKDPRFHAPIVVIWVASFGGALHGTPPVRTRFRDVCGMPVHSRTQILSPSSSICDSVHRPPTSGPSDGSEPWAYSSTLYTGIC